MKNRLGITESITHWAKYTPEKICILTDKHSISYSELEIIINNFSEILLDIFTKEKCIPLLIQSKALLLISIVSTLKIGKYPAILNCNLNQHEINCALSDLACNHMVVEENIHSDLNHYNRKLIVNDEVFNYKSNCIIKHIVPNLSDTWGILYSSGSTGNPKGILRTHYSILSELLGWCLELETRHSSHYYISRPIYYTGGLVLTLTSLLVGGSVSLYEEFNPRFYFNHIDKYNIEMSFLVPLQIKSLIDFIHTENLEITKHAKFILCMGAPFPSKLKMQAVKYLKSNVIESWGNTEGLGTITKPEDVYLRPDSIGRPFLADNLIIVDDSFKEIGINKIGRLAGRVDSRFSQYMNRKDLNDKFIKKELIISEDIGRSDKDGYFYLYGRISDVIKTKKKEIYPICIEKEILAMEQVEDVALIGIPYDNYQKPVLLVKVYPKYLKQKEYICSSIMENTSDIAEILLINDFPRTASGKIARAKLIELYQTLKARGAILESDEINCKHPINHI